MRNLIPGLWAALALLCLAGTYGCTKEHAASSTGAPGGNAFATSFTPDSAAREAAVADYQQNYLGTAVSDIGWTGSSVNCDPGNTPDSVKQKEVQRLNYFRRLVGLPEVSLNSTYSAKAQQAALMMKDNDALDHYPPDSWKCVTPDGQLAAANSNLTLGTAGPAAIDLYIDDEAVVSLGHRRWALFPPLTQVGSGDTDFSNALWVIGGFGTRPVLNFSAYPGNGYIPAPLVFQVWSFSVSAANFSEASVQVTDTQGNPYPVNLSLTDTGCGDNTLAWTFQQDFKTLTSDLQLNVTVSGVKVAGQTHSYTYSVCIMAM
jgi:uncharacterized protein YkwD